MIKNTNILKGIFTVKANHDLSIVNADELDVIKEKLNDEDYKDSLTGLLNRKGIMEAFASLVERQKDKLHGFLIFDIDDFKTHNDRNGRLFGDKVLEEVSKNLAEVFRDEDMVGRLGKDEFVIILADIPGEEALQKKAASVSEAMERVLENGEWLSLSQGIALYPNDGNTFMELYNKANDALSEAKSNGRNKYVVYSEMEKDKQIEESDFRDLNMSRGGMFEFIKKFMDTAPGGIGIYQKQGDKFVTRYVNKGLLEILGLSREKYNQRYKEDGFKIISEKSQPDLLSTAEKIMKGAEGESGSNIYKVSEEIHSTPKYLFAKIAQINFDKESEPLIIALSVDVSKEKQIDRELREIQEIYIWGLEKGTVGFWELDIEKNTFVNSAGEFFGSIEDMVTAGEIHIDSVLEFARIKERVIAGEKEGEFFIKGQDRAKGFEWQRISYRTMGSKAENSVRVFFVGEALPGEIKSKTTYIREEWIKKELQNIGLRVYKTNLSANKVEENKAQSDEITGALDDKKAKTYEDVLNSIGESFVKHGKKENFKRSNSRKTLLENFQNGRDSSKEMIQTVDESGKLRWTTIYNRIIIHPSTGDYYSYIYLKHDDEKWRRENASVEQIPIDSMTGIYDEAALPEMVNKVLKQRKDNNAYGLIMLDMANYYSQKSRQGDKAFTRNFIRLAEDIRLLLPSTQIVSLKGRGKFIIFLEVEQNESIKEVSGNFIDKLKEVFRILDPKNAILFYGGIALWNPGDNYEKLYQKALIARNLAGIGDNWGYAFFEGKENTANTSGLISKQPVTFANTELEFTKDDDGFIKEDKELVQTILSCSANFLEKKDLEIALLEVCEILADYYYSEKIFLMEFKEAPFRQGTSLLWQRGTTGLLKDRDFPEAAIYASTFLEGYKRKEGFISKDILAVPFMIDDIFGGFVGVIKPTRYQGDLRLLHTVSYIMGTELYRVRLREGKDYDSLHDPGTGFYNRREYNNALEQLEMEGLSSLGVLMVEINEVATKNTMGGMKDTESKAIQVAEIIRRTCLECKVFRVTEREFVMLCTDATLEHFMATSTSIYDDLLLNMEGITSLGYCWSGEDIEINRLLQHAEELKKIDRLKYRGKSYGDQEKDKEEALTKLLQEIKDKRFSVSIQPIIEASTGKIRGGEALVRRIDDEGYLRLPIEFIRNFETLGIIRYIDLFVLEEACKEISGWIEKGGQRVPISVNFSRETLLESDIISQLITISEKYKVPRELIEIEVTERLGDLEESTIMGIAKSIKESGYGLSLDDFGTEYSNLSVVSRLKLDTLKIDRSLISQINENKTTEVIIKSVLQLCKELGINSVGEGVETIEQIDALKEWGCDYLQGFYYSKAIPVEDFSKKYLDVN